MLLKITYWLCTISCRLLTITCWLLTIIHWLHTFTVSCFLAAYCYMLATYHQLVVLARNGCSLGQNGWLGFWFSICLAALFQYWLAWPQAQPRLAARFEIGWQPHYPDTLLFLTLIKGHVGCEGQSGWHKSVPGNFLYLKDVRTSFG